MQVGSAAFCGADHQPAKRGSGGAVLRRDEARAVSLGNLDITSTSRCCGTYRPRAHAQVYGCFLEEFTMFFFVKVNSDPEVDSACSFPEAAVGFSPFLRNFRTPSGWTSSAQLAATFFEPSMANSCWSSSALHAAPINLCTV